MKVFILPTDNIMTTAYYYSLLEKIFKAAGFEVVMCSDLSQFSPNKKEDLIVTGNAYPTVKLWLKGYRNICTWYQGVVPEERKMQGYSGFKVFLHTCIEKWSLIISKFRFFVSNAIKDHYERKYHLCFKETEYAIIPCFNDKKTYDNCFQDGVKTPYSFIYSGGMGVWQCFDKTLKVFKKIKDDIPEATLDIYTYQVEQAKEAVLSNGIKDVNVSYIPKDEMSEALSSKMFGFVLRDDVIVNQVATPTKFSNYLAMGVIPVFSNCIKDFASITSGLYYFIPINSSCVNEIEEELLPSVKKISRNYDNYKHRQECDTIFSTYYSEEVYINTISKVVKIAFAFL